MLSPLRKVYSSKVITSGCFFYQFCYSGVGRIVPVPAGVPEAARIVLHQPGGARLFNRSNRTGSALAAMIIEIFRYI